MGLTLRSVGKIIALTFATVWSVSGAMAQDAASFPSRSIGIVVPFAAGGAADILARVAAQYASTENGWQFHIENVTGAGGLIGAQAVARAAPDGYTLLLCNISCAVNQFLNPKSEWSGKTSISPVITVGYLPNVLVVGSSVQQKNLKEFVEYARANPDKVSIATSGPGSSSSMTADLLATQAGMKVREIPYRGSAAATPDLISGRVDGMVMGLPESIPLIREGKVRGFGVTSTERAPSLPDVPTIAEAGVPGYQFLGYLSLFAPKGVPDAVVAKLNAGFNKALASAGLRQRFSELSILPAGGPPALAGKLVNEDIDIWQPILTNRAR